MLYAWNMHNISSWDALQAFDQIDQELKEKMENKWIKKACQFGCLYLRNDFAVFFKFNL